MQYAFFEKSVRPLLIPDFDRLTNSSIAYTRLMAFVFACCMLVSLIVNKNKFCANESVLIFKLLFIYVISAKKHLLSVFKSGVIFTDNLVVHCI